MISNLRKWLIYKKIDRQGSIEIAKEDPELHSFLREIHRYAINSSKNLVHGYYSEFLDVTQKIPLTVDAAKFGVSAHRILICVFMEDLWHVRIIEKIPEAWRKDKEFITMLRGSESGAMKESFIDQLSNVFYLRLGYVFRRGLKRDPQAGFDGLPAFKQHILKAIKGSLSVLAPEAHRLRGMNKFEELDSQPAESERASDISWFLVNEFGKCKTYVDSEKITFSGKVATAPVKYLLDPPGTDMRNKRPVKEMHTIEQFDLSNRMFQVLSVEFIYMDDTRSSMRAVPSWATATEGNLKTLNYVASRFT